MPSAVDRCRARLETIREALPEVEARAAGDDGRHVGYRVRTTSFAWFTVDHHGDGRLALTVRSPPGDQAALIARDPARFFVPAYVGRRGWTGIWLDRPGVDWKEVAELFTEAYRLSAPKKLVALLG